MIIPGVMHEMEEEMLRSFHSVSLLLSSLSPPLSPISVSECTHGRQCMRVRTCIQSKPSIRVYAGMAETDSKLQTHCSSRQVRSHLGQQNAGGQVGAGGGRGRGRRLVPSLCESFKFASASLVLLLMPAHGWSLCQRV